MQRLIQVLLAIGLCSLAGCFASEEQARETVLKAYPKSQIILYEAEEHTGHYFICQSNVVLYVHTHRNDGETVSITKTIALPDTIECGR